MRKLHGIPHRDSRGGDDGSHLNLQQFVFLLVIDGSGGAELLTHFAPPLCEEQAVLPIDHRDVGDCLVEGLVDDFSLAHPGLVNGV